MNNDLNPIEKYPPLTDERLSRLAGALRDVRKDAVALYDPLNGDDDWSHGCRVYSRSKFKIKQLAMQHQWLTIIAEKERLRFTFAVEGIPIRFYRGSPDDPPENYLTTTYGELLQRQLFENLRPLDKVLRLAVETDREGYVATVKLVELDEAGEPTGVYLIPFDVAASNVKALESKAINIKEVTVESLAEQEEQKVQKRKQKKSK